MRDPIDAALDRYLRECDEAERLHNQACDDLAEEGILDPTEEQIDEQMAIVEQRWADEAGEAEVDRYLSHLDDLRSGYY